MTTHDPRPYQQSMSHRPGIRCTCGHFSVELGDTYPVERASGITVNTQVRKMKHCWEAYRMHYIAELKAAELQKVHDDIQTQ